MCRHFCYCVLPSLFSRVLLEVNNFGPTTHNVATNVGWAGRPSARTQGLLRSSLSLLFPSAERGARLWAPLSMPLPAHSNKNICCCTEGRR